MAELSGWDRVSDPYGGFGNFGPGRTQTGKVNDQVPSGWSREGVSSWDGIGQVPGVPGDIGMDPRTAAELSAALERVARSYDGPKLDVAPKGWGQRDYSQGVLNGDFATSFGMMPDALISAPSSEAFHQAAYTGPRPSNAPAQDYGGIFSATKENGVWTGKNPEGLDERLSNHFSQQSAVQDRLTRAARGDFSGYSSVDQAAADIDWGGMVQNASLPDMSGFDFNSAPSISMDQFNDMYSGVPDLPSLDPSIASTPGYAGATGYGGGFGLGGFMTGLDPSMYGDVGPMSQVASSAPMLGSMGVNSLGGMFNDPIMSAVAPQAAPRVSAPRVSIAAPPALPSLPAPIAIAAAPRVASVPKAGVPEGWTPGLGSDGWAGMLDGSGTLAGIGLDMGQMGQAYDSYISANTQPQQGGFFDSLMSGWSTPGLITGALGAVVGGIPGAIGGYQIGKHGANAVSGIANAFGGLSDFGGINLGGWDGYDASTMGYGAGYNSRGERSPTGRDDSGGASRGDGSYSESAGYNDNNPQGIL